MLDTNIVSYIVNGRYPSARARFREADPAYVCISAVTRAEIRFGLKRLAPDHRLHLEVTRFFEGTIALAWDEKAADVHADIRHFLQATGQPIGEMDTMIAAHALAIGAVLVTNNTRHFARIPGLRLENWAADGR